MIHELYEVIDHRKIPDHEKLAAVAVLENLPDLLHVWEHTGKSKSLALTDDNFEQKGDMVTVYTPHGMVNFVPLHPDADILHFIETPMDGLLQNCLQ